MDMLLCHTFSTTASSPTIKGGWLIPLLYLYEAVHPPHHQQTAERSTDRPVSPSVSICTRLFGHVCILPTSRQQTADSRQTRGRPSLPEKSFACQPAKSMSVGGLMSSIVPRFSLWNVVESSSPVTRCLVAFGCSSACCCQLVRLYTLFFFLHSPVSNYCTYARLNIVTPKLTPTTTRPSCSSTSSVAPQITARALLGDRVVLRSANPTSLHHEKLNSNSNVSESPS